MTLQGKIALVTGAGSGIGRAISLVFAREGAQVVVSDINAEGGEDTVAAIKAVGGEAMFQRTDVTDPKAHEVLVDLAAQKFGGLHIACNNAGIGGKSVPLAETSDADWHRVLNTNLSGLFYGLRAQIPAIAASGGGAIVNIASVYGDRALANTGPYVASKHGVVGLTRTAALETARQNIRVNAIGPGLVSTPLAQSMDEKTTAAFAKMNALRRWGQPEEIAELALWLVSAKSSFATGGFYILDGGQTVK